MTKGTDPAVLQRKAGIGRQTAAPAPDALTPDRAWRLAVVRGLSNAIALSCRVAEVRAETVPASAIAGLVGEGDMTLLLEGPSGFGAAILDAQLTAAMIEAQTIGRVLSRTALPRPVTRTDAALIADPLDRVLSEFEERAVDLADYGTAVGLRFATLASSGETMALALPDSDHALSAISLSLGAGDRAGRLQILLPVAPEVREAEDLVEDGNWSQDFERSLLSSAAVLTAVLTRQRMSAEELTRLAPGDLVPVNPQCLSRVALTGCTGQVAACGRLGQSGGMKAILIQDIDPLHLGPP